MPPDHHASRRSPPGPGFFRCQVSRERDTARIQAVGELELATVPILDAELAALRDAGFRRLILDLSDLAFMDSTGLRCILQNDAEARQDGFSIALIPGPPPSNACSRSPRPRRACRSPGPDRWSTGARTPGGRRHAAPDDGGASRWHPPDDSRVGGIADAPERVPDRSSQSRGTAQSPSQSDGPAGAGAFPNGSAMAVDLSLTLPSDRTAAGLARREMARFLGESVGARLGDLELVVSELVDNALLHGRGEIRLALRLDGNRVSGHVLDGGDGFSPTLSERRVDAFGGFGLGIVGRLSSRSGVRDGVSHVWFEMDLAAQVAPSRNAACGAGQHPVRP